MMWGIIINLLVTEVIEQFHCGKAPGVDEIHPELLKAWGWEAVLADTSHQHCMSGVADRGHGSHVQKGGPEGVSQLWRHHITPPPRGGAGKEGPSDSRTSDWRGTMRILSWAWNDRPAFYSHKDPGGGLGVCLSSLHVSCGFGKGAWPGSPWNIVGDAAGVWGEGVPTRGPSNLFTPKARAVSGFSAVSGTHPMWGLASVRAAPCHLSCLGYSWTGFQGIVTEEGFQFVGLRIASLLFADVVPMAPSVCDRFAAECEAAGMRIRNWKSEAMVLGRKWMDCLLWVGNEFLPQVKEFKYLVLLFSNEGTMECEIQIWVVGTVLRSSWKKRALLCYEVMPIIYGGLAWVTGPKE